MSYSSGRYCFVLSCLNNSKKNPDKLYFRVPYNKVMRDKWCIGVNRVPMSIKQSSTAYCCSDHFDLEKELDRATSSSGAPKLKDAVIPSLRHPNIQLRNKKTMKLMKSILEPDELFDEATNEPQSSGRYVTEVVYIEEMDNNHFLQESVESEMDCLNVDSENECKNLSTKAFVDISDDENLLGAVRYAMKTLNTTEGSQPQKYGSTITNAAQTPRSKSKREKKNSQKTNTKSLNTQTDKMLEEVQSKTLKLVESKHLKPESEPTVTDVIVVKAKYPFETNSTKSETLPSTKSPTESHPRIVYEEKISKPLTTTNIKSSTLPTSGTFTIKPKIPSILNRITKSNFKSYSILKKRIPATKTQSDDDCIFLDDPTLIKLPLTNCNNSGTSETSSSFPARMGIPSCISVKEIAIPQMTLPEKNIPLQQPKLRVRDFGKDLFVIPRSPNKKITREFKLIQLMISENKYLFNHTTNNPVKISILREHEFKVLDNIFYYRAHDQKIKSKNYFFMNITYNPPNPDEIVQRSYAIYWGQPRISLVGVVETKGILDNVTKNYVFRQVKKSLFDDDGQRKIKVNVMQSIMDARESVRFLSSKSVSTNVPTTEKPSVIKVKNKKAELINNYSNNEKNTIKAPQDAIAVNQASTESLLWPSKRTKKTQPSQVSTNSSVPVRQISSVPKLSKTSETKSLNAHFEGDNMVPSKLSILYSRLSSPMRNFIEKSKHFRLNNGSVYTITLRPKHGQYKQNSFNLTFTKMKPKSGIKPVPEHLPISKLVNEIYDATYAMKSSKLTAKVEAMLPQHVPNRQNLKETKE